MLEKDTQGNNPEQIDPTSKEGKLLRFTQIDERVIEIKEELTTLREQLEQLINKEGTDAINNKEKDGRTTKERIEFTIKQRREETFKLRDEKERLVKEIDEENKEKETTNLQQDLTDLTKVESFTLTGQPINPKQVLEAKNPTNTKAGLYLWNNFKSWLQPKLQDIIITPEQISISSFTLDKAMTGEALKQKLGNAKPFTLDQLATLINNQSEISGNMPKVTSPRDISGKSDLFLVEQVDGSVVVANAYWDSGARKWGMDAFDLSLKWNVGYRVFSCNN